MAGPLGPPSIGLLSDIVLNPAVWRWILFVGQPVRLAIAANVLVGRSIRSVAVDLLRRLKDLIAWLFGRVHHRGLRRFERRYFQVRRWHGVAAVLVLGRLVTVAHRAWAEHTSGRSQRRKALKRELMQAESHE